MQDISPDTALEQTKPGAVALPAVLGKRKCYTLQNASGTVDLSIATLRRLNKAGRLRFIKIGGRTLVDADSLDALVA
jgi:hypothetical protein